MKLTSMSNVALALRPCLKHADTPLSQLKKRINVQSLTNVVVSSNQEEKKKWEEIVP